MLWEFTYNIGPKAPTTDAESPTMRRIASFFQIDHYETSNFVNGRRDKGTNIQRVVWRI
jgi:hypothetical protein